MTNLMTGAVEGRGSHSFVPTVPADIVARQFLSASVSLGRTQVPWPKGCCEVRALQRKDPGQFREKQVAPCSRCCAWGFIPDGVRMDEHYPLCSSPTTGLGAEGEVLPLFSNTGLDLLGFGLALLNCW